MANFLWNIQGSSRVHWVKWSKVCLPLSEGGLGIMGMDQVMELLHAKLMWVAMSGDTLWAKFAYPKYFTEGIPCEANPVFPLWRSLMQHYPQLCRCSRWTVGMGSRCFWVDNWLGEEILGPPTVDATLSIAEGI